MTALKEFQRLESPGLWRPSPGEQRRDVVVSFGDASLIITDTRDRALSHWSLPAVERTNPGEIPALYRPGPDAEEVLEIEDEMMIGAIAKVQGAIARRRPHPGRLRNILLGGGLLLVLALTLFWLPDAIIRHTASVIPQAKRDQIGADLLTEIRFATGAPCASALGQKALDRLTNRVLGEGPKTLILADGALVSAHLPGKTYLLNRAIVEDHETAEVAAGYLLAEGLRGSQSDPVEDLLHHAGVLTSFRLLTTGEIPESAIAGYARHLLTAPQAEVDPETLLARFEAAGVRATPYGFALDITGETTLSLIEADPVPLAQAQPLISDGDWVALQGICGG
ncbi:MAG: hypothetical protein HUJ27_02670 [Rhodobacteraceae bacterium]|nr:hypothetical protein [Paracoccaceae bacterium]